MSSPRRPSPSRSRPLSQEARGASGTGWLARLWERSQELPERVLTEQAQRRDERAEAASRALRPTWDLRLVPAALTAWGAAVAGAVPWRDLAGAGETLLQPGALVPLALLAAAAVLGAALLRRRRSSQGRRWPAAPGRAVGRAAGGTGARPGARASAGAGARAAALEACRAAAPSVLLCLLVAVAVGLRVGMQLVAAEQDAQELSGGAQRVSLDVIDRPTEWHSAPASAFGPAPEEAGEAASGVVVPVRLDTGAAATVFAQDPQWAGTQAGRRYEAVVSDPRAEAGELQLRSSGPPAPAEPSEQQRRSPLQAATERFALAAAARGPDAAGLLPGMTYGDRGGLEQGLERAMKITGLTHLTAVSGSNCALVMALAGQLALGLGLRRRMCVLIGLAALGLFVVLVGPDPSVLRAAVMGAVAALAVLSGRGPVSLAALSTAVCALLVIDPGLGREFGFALSVCATAGIVVTGRPLTRVLERAVPPAAALVLAIPLVAQLWCAPVMALLSPTVATYAVPANVIAAPVVPLVTVLGLAALILLGIGGPVGAGLGELLLHPGSWAVGLIARTARFFAGLPGSTAPWLPPPAGPILMLALSAGVIVAVHRLDARWLRRPVAGQVSADEVADPVREAAWRRAQRRERAWRTAGLAVIGIGAVVVVAVLRWPSPAVQDWSVLACDVGQGDAVLLRGRAGEQVSTVLIDAGPDPGALRSCLAEAGVDRLDLLVLTHDHADHAAGAEGLGSSVEIDQVWWSSASGRAPDELAGLTPAEGPAMRPGIGQSFDGAGIRLTVLGPDPSSTRIRPSSEDENNASLVLRADLAEGDQRFSMLAAGDLEESGAGMLRRADPRLLDVDLLKVSHHGARNGGTAIIDAASPQLAVVSVGEDNDYGHPHPAILEHLNRAGIPVARTDEHGAVAIRAQDGALSAVPAG